MPAAWEQLIQRYRDDADAWLQAQIATRLTGPYQELSTRLRQALKSGGLPALLSTYDAMMREIGQEQQALLEDAFKRAQQHATEAFTEALKARYGTAFYRQLLETPAGGNLPAVLQRLGKGSPPAGVAVTGLPQQLGYAYSLRNWRGNSQTRQEMTVFLQQHLTQGAGAHRMAEAFAQYAADDPTLPAHLRRLEQAGRKALSNSPQAKAQFLKRLETARKVIGTRVGVPRGTRYEQRIALEKVTRAVTKGSADALDAGVRYFTERRAVYRARVLLRSEANRAFQQTSMETYAAHDFVTGVKWNLSRQHDHVDECDLKAEADIGLGKGVYYKGKVPWPDHPNGLCYLSPVLVEPEAVATAKPPTPPPQADRAVEQLKGPLAKQANQLVPLGRSKQATQGLQGLLSQVPEAKPVPASPPTVQQPVYTPPPFVPPAPLPPPSTVRPPTTTTLTQLPSEGTPVVLPAPPSPRDAAIAQEWTPQTTVAEATAYAQRLGTTLSVDDETKVPPLTLAQANRATRTLHRLARVNPAYLPEKVETSYWYFRDPQAASAEAVYDAAQKTVFVNPNSLLRQEIDLARAAMHEHYAKGMFSTDDPDGTLIHEIGHHAHVTLSPAQYRVWRDEPWGDAEQMTARQVSRYAASNVPEFVAETFAGLATGKTYDPEVMALYTKLGGPPVRPPRRD